jgi:hypothetical protein
MDTGYPEKRLPVKEDDKFVKFHQELMYTPVNELLMDII